MAESLDDTVKRLLGSETFTAEELPDVLVQKGWDRAEIDAAIARATKKIAKEDESPARVLARKNARTGQHLLRFGVLWLTAGLIGSIVFGGGVLAYLAVVGVGGALIFAGNRALKSAEIRRTDY